MPTVHLERKIYAVDNDVEGFKRSVCDESEIREVGLWYGHQRMFKRGVDVLKLILSLPEVDVNFSCGPDKRTALHCAASGGSVNAIDAVKLLLLAGADPNSTDANGHRPVDVIVAFPNLPHLNIALEELLKIMVLSPSISLSSEEVYSSSSSGSILSPVACKPNDVRVSSAKKEYPVRLPVPDIKNSIYAMDEFRMFSFKIQPCCRAHSHDWTERDPRMFHYSCVPCPDHRKGVCRRGDLCEYSHGIFECWLHPAQCRTRLCKDGTSCTRRVCFSAAMDFTAALKILSGSPSAVPAMSPSSFAPPTSPSGNGICTSIDWPQQNFLNLKITGNNLQANRLRTSLNARDIPFEELNRFQDFELLHLQLLNLLSCSESCDHLALQAWREGLKSSLGGRGERISIA
ncbi:hypothetical protein P3X46_023939 [Hevea brasiliensis]|uniref:C3H1-type domain-containing protein n=1 Tax=Hevea brasiliensis TaxID=3981 RepID=A0ABQ9LFZ7_HEVBR|nr:hypothetical protein P3X46_023939 [Hevea brasiliensis]